MNISCSRCCGAGPFWSAPDPGIFSPAPASTVNFFFKNIPCSLLEIIHFLFSISFFYKHLINVETNGENIIQNFFCFFLRWSQSKPSHRLRPKVPAPAPQHCVQWVLHFKGSRYLIRLQQCRVAGAVSFLSLNLLIVYWHVFYLQLVTAVQQCLFGH